MKKLVLLLGLGFGGAAFAAPCVATTADNYTGTCTITALGHEWTVLDVSWTSLGTFAEPASQVTLTPLANPGPGLTFTFNGGLFVPAGQVMNGHFHYILDPPPTILDGFGVSLDPTGTSQLTGTISYGIKSPASTPGAPVFTDFAAFGIFLQGNQATHYVLTDFTQFNFQANYVEVDLHIRVGGDVDSTSHGGTTSTNTPEPAAFGLAGLGLTGLLALRRRLTR